MTDLKLNTSTNDLDLTSGTVQLVEGPEETSQRLRVRLKFFLGEWFLDTRQGFPYLQKVLGKKPRGNVIDQLFRRMILGTPGVASLDMFAATFDGATRSLAIAFVAISTTGEQIVIDETFIVR